MVKYHIKWLELKTQTIIAANDKVAKKNIKEFQEANPNLTILITKTK